MSSFEIRGPPSPTFTIRLGVDPEEGGTVSGDGTFFADSSQTVTATPNPGWQFVNWTEGGAEVSTDASYTFTLNADRNLVAHFAQITYTVTTSVDPAGGGTTSGDGTYPSGSSRTVTASPNSGLQLRQLDRGWRGGQHQTPATPSRSTAIAASSPISPRSPTPSATSVDPAGSGTTSGDGTYPAGSSRTVTATPSSGYTFVNWTEGGAEVSTDASYTFTLNGNRSLVAHFNPSPTFTISLGVDPEEGGTVSGDGTFPAGSSRTVTATPNTGWQFVNWTEGGSRNQHRRELYLHA